MDRIQCINCKSDSYNEYSKTHLYCHTCYTKKIDIIKIQEEIIQELLNGIYDIQQYEASSSHKDILPEGIVRHCDFILAKVQKLESTLSG